MTLNPDGRFTRDALQRALRAGTGALALCLLAAGCGGGGEDPSPTASGAATASASTSPTPTNVAPVFTLHEDFFPVPHADADAIPWDEVGPGWFLVDAHGTLDTHGEERQLLPEAVGGLSLVSPEGEWYAARTFAGTGAAESVHWAADGAWLIKNLDVGVEQRTGDIVSVNLATGAIADVSLNEAGDFSYASASGGVTVGLDFLPGHPVAYSLHNASGAADPQCTQNTAVGYGDLRTALSPDGQRVVCWRERWPDEGTDVGFLDLRSPSVATLVDVFREYSWSYQSLGWLSDDAFLLARASGGRQEAFFSYDLSTRKISDFVVPFDVPEDQGVAAYDYKSQVFFAAAWDGDSVNMYRANGDPIAAVAAGCADNGRGGSWRLSGEMILVSCRGSGGGDATLVNLETGEVVGTWPYGPGIDVRVHGYPAHTE